MISDLLLPGDDKSTIIDCGEGLTWSDAGRPNVGRMGLHG